MKNTITLIFISILLIALTCTCEKDYYTVVKGKVTNSETDDPIQDYILEIREMESEWFAWSYHFETLITNSNGDFEFAFEAEENMLYSIRSTDNVEYTEIIQTYLEVGEINEFNFEVKTDSSKTNEK